MAKDVKEILKILFPEYQIKACIDERGFIAKKQEQKAAEVPAPASKPTGKANPSVKNDMERAIKAEDAFEHLPAELKKHWIGSEKDREALCKAFQRPYVKGFDQNIPKNAVLIIGTESRGRVYAVRCISELLRQKNVFQYAGTITMDMLDYASDSADGLFLSDLYQALNADTESVVFENMEKASPLHLDIIYQLLVEGAYRLPRRYMASNGGLVEATGMLTTGLISELGANGKFFVFTTSMPQADVISVLGNKIIKELGDIITLDPIADNQVKDLTDTLCMNLADKCRKNLHIEVEFDELLIDAAGKKYSTSSGVKGLEEYLDDQLYETLSEIKLQKILRDGESITITYTHEDGCCAVLKNGKRIKMSQYLKNYHAAELEETRKELDRVIGLDRVKEYVLNLETNYKVQQMRADKGLKKSDISMHMIFAGNPGTGKTTIARIVAKYLKATGILSSGHLCEVTRADLVGQYVGHTAVKTTDVIKNAVGGVLFIDEAYALCRDKNDTFGLEAVDALVKGMEDYRDDLVVILAGYEDEMQEFLKTNPGLKSRFPNVVHFEDYTVEEMYEIAKVTAASKGYRLSGDCEEGLRREFEKRQVKGKNDGGNGRLVRNLIEAAVLRQSQRIVKNPEDDMELLVAADFGLDQEGKAAEFDLEKELSKVVGLEPVKRYIRSLYARLKLQAERKKAGLKTDNTQTMHMIFAGNPGTGKTMMARMVADILYHMNVITSNNLVETDRSGLVAGYVGQTAMKTRQMIETALGGVLFIDEAYALAQGGENDFGREAIDTLVKMMDDNRDRLVVILAGYNDDMEKFLDKNAGLQSRFANKIEFPDYSTDELMLIADGLYAGQGYVLSAGARTALREEIEAARTDKQFGNGRYVRNVFERSLNNQALRLSGEKEYTTESLTVITERDIREA